MNKRKSSFLLRINYRFGKTGLRLLTAAKNRVKLANASNTARLILLKKAFWKVKVISEPGKSRQRLDLAYNESDLSGKKYSRF